MPVERSTKKSPAKKKAQTTAQDSSKRKQVLPMRAKQRVRNFLSRRPHRSFRLSKRRDYTRSLKLPGYWVFTASVIRVMRDNKKSLLVLSSVYVVASLLLFGLASQEGFSTLRDTISEAGEELSEGNWSALQQSALLAVSTISGSVSPTMSEGQQIYAVLLGLIVWLSTVWLLRQRLAGGNVKVRDALYNAGAPIVGTALLFLVLIVQLLPIALAIIGYIAAVSSGLLSGGGVEAMLFWMAAAALAVLSLYWAISTALALVIVTLPGMYPVRALSIAGDMVSGRRLRILLRVLWLGLLLLLLWIAILIPVILLNTWLVGAWSALEWIPAVPMVVLVLSTVSLICVASYIYVLYRGIVDDDAKPA